MYAPRNTIYFTRRRRADHCDYIFLGSDFCEWWSKVGSFLLASVHMHMVLRKLQQAAKTRRKAKRGYGSMSTVLA